jgi:hypothetical protein
MPDQLRLDFGGGSAELSPAAESTLTGLADRLKDRPQQRIQLKAFASADGGNASQARRLSLSRALAVRSFLIDQGIRSTRMDVRALGDTAESGPLDRVDIVPATRYTGAWRPAAGARGRPSGAPPMSAGAASARGPATLSRQTALGRPHPADLTRQTAPGRPYPKDRTQHR